MFLLLEAIIVFALFAAGCWSGRVAAVFLPVIGVSLIVFAIRFGNPMGLLVSGGGWLILDTMLVIAVIIANIAVLIANVVSKARA
jgi:hypothetical protein